MCGSGRGAGSELMLYSVLSKGQPKTVLLFLKDEWRTFIIKALCLKTQQAAYVGRIARLHRPAPNTEAVPKGWLHDYATFRYLLFGSLSKEGNYRIHCELCWMKKEELLYFIQCQKY